MIEVHLIVPPASSSKSKFTKHKTKKNFHPKIKKQRTESLDMVIGGGTTFAVAWDKLVTANHICDIVDQTPPGVKVEFGLKTFAGDSDSMYSKPLPVIKRDKENDLCLLYIEDPMLVPLLVGRAEDVKPGDQVFAFGMPLGLPNVLTEGFVTLVSKSFETEVKDKMQKWMTLSLPVFFGNSGGPIVNARGEVIGVAVATVPQYPHLSFSSTTEALEKFLFPRGR
jgi:S1-C subfamily serine protease